MTRKGIKIPACLHTKLSTMSEDQKKPIHKIISMLITKAEKIQNIEDNWRKDLDEAQNTISFLKEQLAQRHITPLAKEYPELRKCPMLDIPAWVELSVCAKCRHQRNEECQIARSA